MAEVVRMPKLSDTMTDGVIAKWHKKVGDKVKSGELLADIETDKATMEFESFQDGVLLHIGVQEKQAVPVDSIIAILGKEGEDISSLLNGSTETKKEESKASAAPASSNGASSSSAPAKLPAGVEVVRMPKLSDTMTDGVLAKWHKKVGDKVKSGELLADIETDKATMEFESFQDGVLIYQGIEEGKGTPVDSVIAILGKGGEDIKAILAAVEGQSSVGSKQSTGGSGQSAVSSQQAAVGSQQSAVSTSSTSVSSDARIKASPLAKALAKEKGIDLSQVKGTADNGRITKADIENYKPVAGGSKGSAGATIATGTEGYRDEPASQMRKTIARRLLESTSSAPVFYLNIEVDMDNAIASRNVINAIPDTKVSFNDMVIKACAAALRKHPQVNTTWMGDKTRYYSHIHIGMAVAVEDGLLVPVIRFTDQKSFTQISAEAKELAKKAKDKKLQPSEMEGNTFTVSNLGMFGIESFTSIINMPASCILSVGAIKQVPVVKNGAVVPGNTMMLSLACDHRTVDGATGAAFLQTLKTFIENPVTMLV
ncbi:pyruvate dehydrogenase complex dihydrolipoamide acetyltransferase [Aurantibacillus circumpalustris]|uniref:pyruvate dehydrogenase complex dihydrolipoamide acetyltransferase n=1 Tax=Aurantibacillus circumpalustris TaxID=3036359 RepID=UPI00295AA72C|nr:pyruvate dehydrogenase complex dihydrolipoamide acetyltransferase [Aurantibacillus circumpalustris]